MAKRLVSNLNQQLNGSTSSPKRMRITTNRLGYSDLGNSNEFNITLKRDTSNIALGMSIKPTPIEGEGICIETIETGSPADKAGCTVNDVILQCQHISVLETGCAGFAKLCEDKTHILIRVRRDTSKGSKRRNQQAFEDDDNNGDFEKPVSKKRKQSNANQKGKQASSSSSSSSSSKSSSSSVPTNSLVSEDYVVSFDIVFGNANNLSKPPDVSIDEKTHMWLSAKEYLRDGWILCSKNYAVEIKTKVGPRTVREAVNIYKISQPWTGSTLFAAGRFKFTIDGTKIETEALSRRVLYSAKYDDGDKQDFYWPGPNQLYDSFDEGTKQRIQKAVKKLSKKKNV
jgi:hypothetical protein